MELAFHSLNLRNMTISNAALILSGFMQLSMKKIKEIYGTRHIGRDQAGGLVGLMDLFCFSEVRLYILHTCIISLRCCN